MPQGIGGMDLPHLHGAMLLLTVLKNGGGFTLYPISFIYPLLVCPSVSHEGGGAEHS